MQQIRFTYALKFLFHIKLKNLDYKTILQLKDLDTDRVRNRSHQCQGAQPRNPY